MGYAEFHKNFIFNLRQNRSREGTIVWLAFLTASTGTALSELKQPRPVPWPWLLSVLLFSHKGVRQEMIDRILPK